MTKADILNEFVDIINREMRLNGGKRRSGKEWAEQYTRLLEEVNDTVLACQRVLRNSREIK